MTPSPTWAWQDGTVRPVADCTFAATDQGVLLGLGVFETMRAAGPDPFAITRHLARLRGSAARLAIEVRWSDAELEAAARAVIAAVRADLGPDADQRIVRCRVTVTAGTPGDAPVLLVTGTSTDPWPPTTAVATRGPDGPWVVNERSPLAGVKHTSRAENVIAHDQALAAGADEAILVTTRGHLCEGSASNLFVVVDGRLCTPSLSTGILAGVTRDLLLEAIEVDERDDLTVDDLLGAPEAFLSASTRDVHPIAAVDGRPLPAVPGPLTRAAAEAFRAIAAASSNP